jgi:hypothetical protein
LQVELRINSTPRMPECRGDHPCETLVCPAWRRQGPRWERRFSNRRIERRSGDFQSPYRVGTSHDGGWNTAAPCADETMNPTSENLSPFETCSEREAKANCVVATRRGEQAEATRWSQRQGNAIRPSRRASCRRKRICRGRLRGVLAKPGPRARSTGGTPHVQAAPWAAGGGWSGNGLKGSWVKSGSLAPAGTAPDDRALIGAEGRDAHARASASKRATTAKRRGAGR